ncbi:MULTISPECIES: TadE/TadG family type IV pilus assembly protein [unclassified Rhodosalinus]|uniref:TadE/TadG family type IV pilus assembly protein n=1 Tax=unclassified Rhodosalinus TaxID=2630183 RepID=UPI0035258048
MTIEFAIWMPLFMMILYATIELGIITMRHAMLERGLDMAVRDLRLSTGAPPQYSDLRQSICDNAAIIPDCTNALKLEMVPNDMRAWQSLPDKPDCVDRSEEVNPLREWTPGKSNELMLLRACLKFAPLTPASWLGQNMASDASGDVALVVSSAFVQEP